MSSLQVFSLVFVWLLHIPWTEGCWPTFSTLNWNWCRVQNWETRKDPKGKKYAFFVPKFENRQNIHKKDRCGLTHSQSGCCEVGHFFRQSERPLDRLSVGAFIAVWKRDGQRIKNTGPCYIIVVVAQTSFTLSRSVVFIMYKISLAAKHKYTKWKRVFKFKVSGKSKM